MDRLTATDLQTTCPFKGDAEYWSAKLEDRELTAVAWSYPEPIEGREDIAGSGVLLQRARRRGRRATTSRSSRRADPATRPARAGRAHRDDGTSGGRLDGQPPPGTARARRKCAWSCSALVYLLGVRTTWGQRLDATALSGRDALRPRAIDAAAQLLTTISVASLVLVGGLIVLIALARRRPYLSPRRGHRDRGRVFTTEVLKHVVLPPPVPRDQRRHRPHPLVSERPHHGRVLPRDRRHCSWRRAATGHWSGCWARSTRSGSASPSSRPGTTGRATRSVP